MRKITIRLPDFVYEDTKLHAQAVGVSLAAYIRMAIAAKLKKE